MADVVALFVGVFVLAPVLSWLVGMFNPMGYLGVPPWRVPRCTCSLRGRGLADLGDTFHGEACQRRG